MEQGMHPIPLHAFLTVVCCAADASCCICCSGGGAFICRIRDHYCFFTVLVSSVVVASVFCIALATYCLGRYDLAPMGYPVASTTLGVSCWIRMHLGSSSARALPDCCGPV